MNPLALGDSFLFVYLVFACVVLLLFHVARRALERGPLPRLELKDPYLFACLNGGPAEVVRVCTIDLVDRGLLVVTGDTVHVADGATAFGLRSVEKTILDHFQGGASLSSAAKDSGLQAAAALEYEAHLRGAGLLPDEAGARQRRIVYLCAILALVVVALAESMWVKFQAVNLSAGLMILMAATIAIATVLRNPYRTRRGDEYLASVQGLFTGLRRRASELRPGSGNRDLLWPTALFGVATLPVTEFPVVALFQPKPKRNDSCGGVWGGGVGGGGGGCDGGGGSCGGGGGSCGGGGGCGGGGS